MARKHRYDGTLLRDLPPLKVVNPYVMRGRNESVVFSAQELVFNEALAFIREYNHSLPKDEPKLSPFHIVLCAIVRALTLRPQLNRFIAGQKVYQRNRIQISFIIKKELTDEGHEANAKITFDPYVTLPEIITLVNKVVKDARRGPDTASDEEISLFSKLPRFALRLAVKAFKLLDYYGYAPKSMIESDPLFTSIYLANLGSVGLDAPFHHLFEWGNASLFLALGKLHREPRLKLDGSVEVLDIMRCNVSFDDRVSEGIYCAKAFQLMSEFVKNPRQLLEKPVIPEAVLRELRLKA